MNKKVNIYPSMPITRVNPPIRSSVRRVTKSVEEIRICLLSRAVVEEILPNGEIIRLNMGNYDNCNNTCTTEDLPINTVKNEEPAKQNTEKSLWQIEYENALAGKDLASMTRKQRRSVEASARAIADAAVASMMKSENDETNVEQEYIVETIDIEAMEDIV